MRCSEKYKYKFIYSAIKHQTVWLRNVKGMQQREENANDRQTTRVNILLIHYLSNFSFNP